MFAAGVGLFTLGYALLYTGVQRFRGNNLTLIQALGGQGGAENRVATATQTAGATGSAKPSSSTGSATATPASTGVTGTNTGVTA